MRQPESNGLFEVAGGKKPKERGFNCMQLVKFLTNEISNGGDNSWEYWHGRHLEASEGKCAYREQCPIYAKTIKNRPIQLNIF